MLSLVLLVTGTDVFKLVATCKLQLMTKGLAQLKIAYDSSYKFRSNHSVVKLGNKFSSLQYNIPKL